MRSGRGSVADIWAKAFVSAHRGDMFLHCGMDDGREAFVFTAGVERLVRVASGKRYTHNALLTWTLFSDVIEPVSARRFSGRSLLPRGHGLARKRRRVGRLIKCCWV